MVKMGRAVVGCLEIKAVQAVVARLIGIDKEVQARLVKVVRDSNIKLEP